MTTENPIQPPTQPEPQSPALALNAGSAFGWNPAHAIGTCDKCGAEMRYNVPRLGPDGGYVHAANGGLDCFANDLTIKIEHYFATVTPEQLDADLKAASGRCAVATGSAAEAIAAKELLRRWVRKYAPSNIPGAWDYDREAVELIETSAALLGIEHPWRQQNK